MLNLKAVSRFAHVISMEGNSVEFDKAIVKGIAQGWMGLSHSAPFVSFLRQIADEIEQGGANE